MSTVLSTLDSLFFAVWVTDPPKASAEVEKYLGNLKLCLHNALNANWSTTFCFAFYDPLSLMYHANLGNWVE